MGDSDMEILAKWMIKHGYATGHGDTMEDLLEELEWQIAERSQRAVEVEREACARLCEQPITEIQITDDCSETIYKDYKDCAEAIRLRGQK